jgi:hypothetical protein
MKELKFHEVNMCSHCPFSTAEGKYYCVLSARTIPDEYSVPSWCQLNTKDILVTLRDNSINETILGSIVNEIENIFGNEGWYDGRG